MKCKICNCKSKLCFNSVILNKYDINYYHCPNCGFVQTEEPFWLDEAYSRSINLSDTGYMVRNLYYSKKLTVLLFFMYGKNGVFLDYAGGYGVFVRLMRDVGFEFFWDDKFTNNLFSSGFEKGEICKFDAITLFEVFEHFTDPIAEIVKLFDTTDTIIFSTELYPEPLPKPNDWWYYGLDHGQHISFFSKRTLEFISEKFDVNYYNMGSLHILTKNKLSKFVIFTEKFSKFGIDKFVSRFIKTKTWSDYEYILRDNRNENSF